MHMQFNTKKTILIRSTYALLIQKACKQAFQGKIQDMCLFAICRLEFTSFFNISYQLAQKKPQKL